LGAGPHRMSCPPPGFRGDFTWNQSPRSELASRGKKGMFFRESIADCLSPAHRGRGFPFLAQGEPNPGVPASPQFAGLPFRPARARRYQALRQRCVASRRRRANRRGGRLRGGRRPPDSGLFWNWGACGFSAAIAFAASAASRAKCSLRAASRNVHQTGIDRWPSRSILPSGSRPASRVISRARSWYGSGRPIALHLAIAACRRNPASAS
jgi:hypothetical protein